MLLRSVEKAQQQSHLQSKANLRTSVAGNLVCCFMHGIARFERKHWHLDRQRDNLESVGHETTCFPRYTVDIKAGVFSHGPMDLLWTFAVCLYYLDFCPVALTLIRFVPCECSIHNTKTTRCSLQPCLFLERQEVAFEPFELVELQELHGITEFSFFPCSVTQWLSSDLVLSAEVVNYGPSQCSRRIRRAL